MYFRVFFFFSPQRKNEKKKGIHWPWFLQVSVILAFLCLKVFLKIPLMVTILKKEKSPQWRLSFQWLIGTTSWECMHEKTIKKNILRHLKKKRNTNNGSGFYQNVEREVWGGCRLPVCLGITVHGACLAFSFKSAPHALMLWILGFCSSNFQGKKKSLAYIFIFSYSSSRVSRLSTFFFIFFLLLWKQWHLQKPKKGVESVIGEVSAAGS